MNYKILITSPFSENLFETLKLYPDTSVHRFPEATAEQLINSTLLKNTQFLIIGKATRITNELLDKAPELRAIISMTAGVDHIDLNAAQERNIAVHNCPGANSRAVAEFCLTSVLMLVKNLNESRRSVLGDTWRVGLTPNKEFSEIVVGVWGFGNIGRLFAEMCAQLGLKVLAFDKVLRKSPHPSIKFCMSLEELASQSDVLSIHVPLHAETRDRINSSLLYLMPKGSYLVNSSRGEIVCEKSLLAALKSEHIRGAALDVWRNEPSVNSELASHPAVIATPHIAWFSSEAIHRSETQAMAHLNTYMSDLNYEEEPFIYKEAK